LAAQNLKNAKMINKSYPGLETFNKEIDSELDREARNFDVYRDDMEVLFSACILISRFLFIY
jgi:hypothetical protein